MMRTFVMIGVFALSACEAGTRAIDSVARQSAKAAVEETLTTRFPDVPKSSVLPFSDCVIDNASAREIGEFAKDAVIGVDETTAVLVLNVMKRPQTQTCVAKASLAALTE